MGRGSGRVAVAMAGAAVLCTLPSFRAPTLANLFGALEVRSSSTHAAQESVTQRQQKAKQQQHSVTSAQLKAGSGLAKQAFHVDAGALDAVLASCAPALAAVKFELQPLFFGGAVEANPGPTQSRPPPAALIMPAALSWSASTTSTAEHELAAAARSALGLGADSSNGSASGFAAALLPLLQSKAALPQQLLTLLFWKACGEHPVSPTLT
jgi:hypothetical protein